MSMDPESSAMNVRFAQSTEGVLAAIGISVPWLVKAEGWSSGEKFLYLTLVGYLGASVLYVLALALSEASLAAAAVARHPEELVRKLLSPAAGELSAEVVREAADLPHGLLTDLVHDLPHYLGDVHVTGGGNLTQHDN
jgi:hypothetical protein